MATFARGMEAADAVQHRYYFSDERKSRVVRMKIYNEKNAPEAARPMLAHTKERLGAIPSVMGVAAASPNILRSLTEFLQRFRNADFQPGECEVVLLAACRAYGSEYALEFESWAAEQSGLPEHVIKAISRADPEHSPIQDERYNGLWQFVSKVVAKEGDVDRKMLKSIKHAGFTDAQVLEVLFGIKVALLMCQIATLAQLKPERKFRWSGSQHGFLGLRRGQ